MQPLRVFLGLALFTPALFAGVTPDNLHRSRYANTVTITATGTAATLDGAPFPLDAATAVTTVGYHELTVTDPAANPQTQTYGFIVRNSARGSTEDGLPTMVPYRMVMDAPSAFADAVLNVMVPAVYPKGLPVPVMARLTKGASFGTAAGDPLFLNGRVSTENFVAHPLLLRRGWGSTILPAAPGPRDTAFDASIHGRTANAPVIIEESTTWTQKSGNVAASESWGMNKRIHLSGNLTVAAGATITIDAGTIVRCDPGAEIWVRPGGSVQINGTREFPVVFVPENTDNPWGGFWLQPENGGNVARLTATGVILCCWGADQDWFDTPPGEPDRDFPHHRDQQPCVAVADGAVCTLTDAALIGPTGLNQTRGAAFASHDGSLVLTRVLVQRCITGGEQEGCPEFEVDSSAFLEMNEPGIDVDSEAFSDADNDGLYLVPGGNTYNLRKTVIGWVKDDGIDTGADGPGTVTVRGCWFENCIHEAISNSGVDRVPQSYDSVHFNSGQGMECGYGGPHSLVQHCAIIGNMVGARYGDNYGNNSGSSGGGTSQYLGDITAKDSLLLYNYFHDAWAIDFSRWTYSNDKFIMTGTKVSKAGDLAAQNGAEDSGNSLWNPAADGALLAPFMPVAGSDAGIDFAIAKRQDTRDAWPAEFPVRLSTFSSRPTTVTWRIAGRSTPESAAETEIASGTLTWQPGETVKFFSAPQPDVAFGLVVVSLSQPVNGAVTGIPLLFFPSSGPPPDDVVLIPRNAGGWDYHAEPAPQDWTTAMPWPARDAESRAWTHPLYTLPDLWYTNRTTPMGWGPIGTSGALITFGTTITERPVTVYARRTFTIADPANIQSLRLECMADDGASVYLNGTRVSPTTWGLDPGTSVGGTLHYNQLSSRFRENGETEHAYDALTLTGASIQALNAAPAVNVLAVELHQNSVDSSDCSLDASLAASFSAPVAGTWGVGTFAQRACLYWTDPAWVVETSTALAPDSWTPRPDLQSPVPLQSAGSRRFFRLRVP